MAQSQLVPQTPIEVLAPELDMISLLAKTAEIEELFKIAFIPTERASQYFRWLDELRLLKQCGRVIGPRDVGKTRASIEYRTEDAKRVSYVKAWSNSSSRRLFSQILKDIDHAAPKGRREDLRPRLAGCLEPFGIELLIIDNADNLQREVLVDLKHLHEESGISIVLMGEHYLDSMLEEHDYQECFPSLFEFHPLDDKDFVKTLRTIEKDVLNLPQDSNLDKETMLEILTTHTEARMGKIIKILTKAVLHSLKKGHGKVDEGILCNIANRYGRKYSPLVAEKNKEKEAE